MQARVAMNPWVFFIAMLMSMAVIRCQVSGVPQFRPASVPLTQWQVVQGSPYGTALDPRGVAPATGPFAAGIVTENAAVNDVIPVLMNGVAPCLFSNLPVQGHSVTVGSGGAGFCVDDARPVTAIPSSLGVLGIVKQVMSATSPFMASVTLFGPLHQGHLVDAASLDPATVPSYVQANQTPQVNANWNASSGVAQILNKPTLAAVATSGSASDLTSGTLPNARLSAIPNSALANSSTTVNGQPCALGSTCTVSVPTNIPAFYLNGTLQSNVKCGFLTATTNGSGIATFNYSSLGLTSLLGQPQASIQGTGTNPYFVNLQGAATTTGATVYASVGSIISVVGINVSLIGVATSAPVGLFVCGV